MMSIGQHAHTLNRAAQGGIGQGGALVRIDRFPVVLGRSIPGAPVQPDCDVAALDPRALVSKQHARLEWHEGGRLHAVDMGSTNGVEYNGQRISRRAIAEGDIYRICDHEVHFTYS